MARWWDDRAARGAKAAGRVVVLVPGLLFAASMVALLRQWELVFWVCAAGAVLTQYVTIHRR